MSLDKPWRRRVFPKSEKEIKWKVVCPKLFGGGVRANVLVGTVGVSVMDLRVRLYRKIGHFVDYSRCSCHYASDQEMVCYATSDLLLPDKLNQWVKYNATYYSNGVVILLYNYNI